jgi:hypothetical protein
MREGLVAAGMGEALIEAIMGMSTGMREGYQPDPPRVITTTTPTTLESWAYDVLRPAIRGQARRS